jgi:hypothetical protein
VCGGIPLARKCIGQLIFHKIDIIVYFILFNELTDEMKFDILIGCFAFEILVKIKFKVAKSCLRASNSLHLKFNDEFDARALVNRNFVFF